MNRESLSQLLWITLDWFVPLGYAVLAASLTQKIRLINVSLEASIILGAFGFSAGCMLRGPYLGVLLAVVCGVAVGFAQGFPTVFGKIDEIAAGVAVNLAFYGLSVIGAFLLTDSRDVDLLPLAPPSPLVRLAILSSFCLISAGILRVSSWGRWITAIGEENFPADLADIPVRGTSLVVVVWSSIVGSVGGIELARSLSGFSDNHWKIGIGFVAIGLAFAARNRLSVGLAGALAFSLLKSGALCLRFEMPGKLVGYLSDLMPYAGIIAFFAIVSLIRSPKRHQKTVG